MSIPRISYLAALEPVWFRSVLAPSPVEDRSQEQLELNVIKKNHHKVRSLIEHRTDLLFWLGGYHRFLPVLLKQVILWQNSILQCTYNYFIMCKKLIIIPNRVFASRLNINLMIFTMSIICFQLISCRISFNFI